MSRASLAVVAALVFLVPMTVSAQSIGGSVTDTTGGVLPGVTVEARASALAD